jgi:aldose sugar dehydrogenase
VKLNRKRFVIPLSFGILSLILIGNSCSLSYGQEELGTKFGPAVPEIYDHDLKVEEVFRGLHFPTQIAFVGPDDILVIEKNNGTVSRILNGTISSQPILDVNVATEFDKGMVGIAVLNGPVGSYVFLYFTEADSKDGGKALGNRLYRYELINDKLIRPKLLLDLPATPGPIHNGGAIVIGPDGNVYLSVGDIHGSCEVKEVIVNSSCQTVKTKAQNYHNGDDPDGRAGILRVTSDGHNVGAGILGSSDPIIKYYAYGMRSSFGLDFDPITGNLWDTENGPDYGDEINLIKPGFNSGWDKVAGIWKPIWKVNGTIMGDVTLKPDN